MLNFYFKENKFRVLLQDAAFASTDRSELRHLAQMIDPYNKSEGKVALSWLQCAVRLGCAAASCDVSSILPGQQ